MLYCVCYICSISNILCLQHLLPTVDLWWYQYPFSFVLHVFRSRSVCVNKILQFYFNRSHAGFCSWCYRKQNKYSFCGIPYNVQPIHCTPYRPPFTCFNMAENCRPICSCWEMACVTGFSYSDFCFYSDCLIFFWLCKGVAWRTFAECKG